jgi:TonB-dependent starch-binding outer membrane protein SusC
MSRSFHRTTVGATILVAATLLVGCSRSQSSSAPHPRKADSVDIPYGTQSTREQTGSVGTVKGETARRDGTTSIADMLDGRIAGVEVRRLPGGGMSIRIRGTRSLNSNNEPLYVIDGVPRQPGPDGAFPDLDPQMIDKIEVLKDAGSLAAYGSRGANGVILITTRKS